MSSFSVDITALTKDLSQDLKRFQKEALPKVEAMAINKVMTAVKGRTAKSVSAATKIKQKLIRARIGVFKRGKQKKVSILTHDMPISILKPKGRLPKNVSRATFAGRKYPRAFQATMRSGKHDIFQRRGKSRLPIDKVTVPIKYIAEPVLRKVADRVTKERFPKEFERAMNREIARYVRRGKRVR